MDARGHRDDATSDAMRKGNVNALLQFHIDAGSLTEGSPGNMCTECDVYFQNLSE